MGLGKGSCVENHPPAVDKVNNEGGRNHWKVDFTYRNKYWPKIAVVVERLSSALDILTFERL